MQEIQRENILINLEFTKISENINKNPILFSKTELNQILTKSLENTNQTISDVNNLIQKNKPNLDKTIKINDL